MVGTLYTPLASSPGSLGGGEKRACMRMGEPLLTKHGAASFHNKTAFRGDRNQCLSDLPHLSLLDTHH